MSHPWSPESLVRGLAFSDGRELGWAGGGVNM